MGAVCNGIALFGGFRPFCATFLVFADYMRPTIRLASLMKIPVIYVFTHDSIFVGEDGPTHQPVEHLQSLRIIPGMVVLRPGDAQETAAAWALALSRSDGPTALALTRQNLEVYEKADKDWVHSCGKGAYIVRDSDDTPDLVIVATGSEVNLALQAAARLTDTNVRVVSMISRELFLAQDRQFRETVLPPGVKTVVAEAGVTSGWEGIASSPEHILGLNRFGESGPGQQVADHLGISVDGLLEIINR
jgi:transketolase